MEYRQIQGLSKPVSRLVMGTVALDAAKEEESFRLLDDVYALGVNTFDTATVYPNNGEAVLARWIGTRGVREMVVVLTKGAHHNQWRSRVTPYDIMADVSDSLAKPGMEYIDIFMLHRDDPSVPVATIIDLLNRLRESGKIRSFGCSNWTRERVQEANEYAARYGLAGFTSVSPQYSLAEQLETPWRGCVTLTGKAAGEDRAYYARSNMPIFAYSSLGRGFFSGRIRSDDAQQAGHVLDKAAQKAYVHACNFRRLARAEELAEAMNVTVPQIALAWVLNQTSLNTFLLVGAKTGAHMAEDVQALRIRLTPEQIQWLNLEKD